MKVVLLSGGSGTRLWPVSTECCPKQFIPFFEENESMLNKTYNNVKKIFPSIYVATQKSYINLIDRQINERINFIIEPDKIGTFGAVLNIANYFKYVENLSDNELISIIPTDHDVDSTFYSILDDASLYLQNSNINVCLIGIKPSYPSTQYGYIIHENNIVKKFKEKPDTKTANKLIQKKALWNSGILVFKLKFIIDISKKYLEYNTYEQFVEIYSKLPKNSFDKEILEKIDNIGIIKSNKIWNDLGTWENLSKKISLPDKYNTNIINFENKKIKNNGVNDSIIVNSKDGILLVKKNVDEIFWRHWGNFKIIDNYQESGNNIKIKLLNILKNNNISYQFHKYRNEVWFILSGCGEVILDKKIIHVSSGDIIQIPKRKLHSIKAIEDIQIIEVQYGIENSEEDIVRLETDWLKTLKLLDKTN